jgi:hypothetical protein
LWLHSSEIQRFHVCKILRFRSLLAASRVLSLLEDSLHCFPSAMYYIRNVSSGLEYSSATCEICIAQKWKFTIEGDGMSMATPTIIYSSFRLLKNVFCCGNSWSFASCRTTVGANVGDSRIRRNPRTYVKKLKNIRKKESENTETRNLWKPNFLLQSREFLYTCPWTPFYRKT